MKKYPEKIKVIGGGICGLRSEASSPKIVYVIFESGYNLYILDPKRLNY